MCSTSTSTTQKTFPELKEIDSLLRCGICYEYMKNALVTSCSHNYCSYCIRKFMQYKTQCPTCFKETAEPQLRNNRVVDQLIVLFLKVSEKIEDLAAQKDWYIVDTSKLCNDSEKNLLNKSGEVEYRRDVSIQPSYQESPSTSTPRMKILVPDMFTPKRKVKIRPAVEENIQTVPCPVCNVDIPERNINVHLDACLAKSKEEPRSSLQTSTRKPLPKLVYPLLQEKDLRRKLKELGLNTLGDRKTLINRHQRFTVLYNSECDSLNPRSVSEILDQVAQEERLEKKQTSGNNLVTAKAWLTVDKKSDPSSIAEAQKQYLKENKSSFATLIEKVKNQRKPSTSEKPEETPGLSNAETVELTKKESPEHRSDKMETNSCDSMQDSPEICSVAEIVPHVAAGSLHSSFDLFEQPNSSPVANYISIKASMERSPTVSPLRTDVNLRTPPRKSTSAASSPRTPDFTPNGPARFSPNFCIKPPKESTPSPLPNPKSPVLSSRNVAKENMVTNASSVLANDDFGGWLEVMLEDHQPNRRKRSVRSDLFNAESARGRTLRKRQKK